MAPGYDLADFEAGKREGLLQTHPQFREAILALTRNP
jgi:predicted cupin superfamily sugar epimerase